MIYKNSYEVPGETGKQNQYLVYQQEVCIP